MQFWCWLLDIVWHGEWKLSDEPSKLQRGSGWGPWRRVWRSWYPSGWHCFLWNFEMDSINGEHSVMLKLLLLVSQVKPGLPYLDIIRLLRDKSPLPIAAYQVWSVTIWILWSCTRYFQFWLKIFPSNLYDEAHDTICPCIPVKTKILISSWMFMPLPFIKNIFIG